MGYSSYYYDDETKGEASGDLQQQRLRDIYMAQNSNRAGATIAMDGTIRRSQPPRRNDGHRSTGGIVIAGEGAQRVSFYNEHRSNRFQGNRSAIVGMDGTVQSVGSSKGRSSRSTSTTSSQRSPPQAIYMAPDGFQEEVFELSVDRSASDRRRRCRKWLIAL